jgi:hypothetical protein
MSSLYRLYASSRTCIMHRAAVLPRPRSPLQQARPPLETYPRGDVSADALGGTRTCPSTRQTRAMQGRMHGTDQLVAKPTDMLTRMRPMLSSFVTASPVSAGSKMPLQGTLASVHLVALVSIRQSSRPRADEHTQEDLREHKSLRHDELPELDRTDRLHTRVSAGQTTRRARVRTANSALEYGHGGNGDIRMRQISGSPLALYNGRSQRRPFREEKDNSRQQTRAPATSRCPRTTHAAASGTAGGARRTRPQPRTSTRPQQGRIRGARRRSRPGRGRSCGPTRAGRTPPLKQRISELHQTCETVILTDQGEEDQPAVRQVARALRPVVERLAYLRASGPHDEEEAQNHVKHTESQQCKLKCTVSMTPTRHREHNTLALVDRPLSRCQTLCAQKRTRLATRDVSGASSSAAIL